MNDLFSYAADLPPPFKDIHNTRETVAQEKARLCQHLNAMLRSQPVGLDTVQKVRQFKIEYKAALKILSRKTSSRQELESAINSMAGFYRSTP